MMHSSASSVTSTCVGSWDGVLTSEGEPGGFRVFISVLNIVNNWQG